MYIEIPAANIRKRLISNLFDPKGLTIFLTREEVSRISIRPTPYIILDETNPALPVVELESHIYRTGYTEVPV
jgi:hypothetical protein